MAGPKRHSNFLSCRYIPLVQSEMAASSLSRRPPAIFPFRGTVVACHYAGLCHSTPNEHISPSIRQPWWRATHACVLGSVPCFGSSCLAVPAVPARPLARRFGTGSAPSLTPFTPYAPPLPSPLPRCPSPGRFILQASGMVSVACWRAALLVGYVPGAPSGARVRPPNPPPAHRSHTPRHASRRALTRRSRAPGITSHTVDEQRASI